MRSIVLSALAFVLGISAASASAPQQPFYGAMSSGGKYGHGFVYKLTPPHNHVEHIWDFCAQKLQDGKCYDGSAPVGNVHVWPDGNRIMGVTSGGGPRGFGVIYSLSLDLASGVWSNTTAFNFCVTFQCEDGIRPDGGFRRHGHKFYATSENPKSGHGVVWEIIPRKDGSYHGGPVRYFH